MMHKTRKMSFDEETAMLDEAVKQSEKQSSVHSLAPHQAPSIARDLEKLNEVIFDLITNANQERICYSKQGSVESQG